MNQKLTRRSLLCAGLALPLFAGCGGGSGESSAGVLGGGNATRGTLSLSLSFSPTRAPKTLLRARAFGGNIPIGTHAVSVTVTNTSTGAKVADPKLITAPLSRPGPIPTTVHVDFANIPVGPVTVKAVAYPDQAGRGTPLATGSTTGQITAGATTNVLVPFTLTLVMLKASPTTVPVSSFAGTPSHTAQVTASVLDGSDKPLQLPIYWLSQDPGIAQVAFDPNNPGTATITGVALGNTIVTLVEPNSGMTATVQVATDPE
jgi:hypothetical protein